MRTARNALLILLALGTLWGCAPVSEDDAWIYGTDEPTLDDKADGNNPLTIYFSRAQQEIRKRLGVEQMGDLSRGRTAYLNLDGRSFPSSTVLIFKGQVHRYDGVIEDHEFVIAPRHIPATEGSANPDGFLAVDFKDANARYALIESESPFAEQAGVFRGDIIATDELTLGRAPAGDIYDYAIRPERLGQRPPNLLRDVEIHIRPNAVLTELTPAGGCSGDQVVDTTVSVTALVPVVTIEGFPVGSDVTVEVKYVFPHYAASNVAAHLWDYVTGIAADDVDELVVSQQIVMPNTPTTTLTFEPFTTLDPPWGDDMYGMDVEVRAYESRGSGAASMVLNHQLTVVETGEVVIVDQFELCPPDDDACRQLRDGGAAENIIARRNVIEWKADRDGLYANSTRAIGRCAGGDRIDGSYANACNVYQESTDTDLEYNLRTQLNFELEVNGEAGGSASWSGSYGGLASADVAAAFSAAFELEFDLQAKFATSRVWRTRNSLDVFYDPSEVQIQWWRVVTPRVRYLELADFDACGVRRSSHEVFLSDLRQSRLVLACESVPRYDSVCYAVEPNTESVDACNGLLIDPQSAEGQMCEANR